MIEGRGVWILEGKEIIVATRFTAWIENVHNDMLL